MPKDLSEKIKCACGCGEIISRWIDYSGKGFDSLIKERKFVHGHNRPWQGKHIYPSMREAISRTLKGKRREKSRRWNGGITVQYGYSYELCRDHPSKRSNNYVAQHRLVMEKIIGRKLKRTEVVHHIDYDRSNNHPSNLILFDSQSEHSRHHQRLLKSK